MKQRIIFGLVLIGAIFYTPWWIVAVLAVAASFLWSPYYEIIGFGLLVDLLYGTSASPLGGTLGLVVAILIFFVGSYAKKIVR